MAPEPSRFARQITFALLVPAAVATEIAAVDSRPLSESAGLATLWIVLAALLGWIVTKYQTRRNDDGTASGIPRLTSLVLLLLAVAPFFVEPLRRSLTGVGYPLELRMVFGLRNLGLGLAAFAVWPLCLRLAGVVSLFLTLFAVSMTSHPLVLALLGVYGAIGSIWLMTVYWTRLLPSFVVAEHAVDLYVQAEHERPPWLAVLAATGLVGAALGLVAIGPRRAATVLAEWLPTSGGTGGYDPFARGGINDGEDEVKGENARSTGMTQTDTFLDSPLPSLYDMFNDLYGEPYKPQDTERSIGLAPKKNTVESRKPPADNLRPNREFAVTRNSPRRPRDPADRAARALFEVQGRTPLHVRAAAFDAFDGLAWREAPPNLSVCRLDKEPDSCWMRVKARTPPPVFAGTESHQFKIAGPVGALVPTPPHLSRFRVGRVDQASFFAWGQDRVVRMAQRKTPSGIVIETESKTVDPRLFESIQFPGPLKSDLLQYSVLPTSLSSEVASLAHRWADQHPTGWPQIAAVIGHLRADYTLDPTARVPADICDPLGHFLLRSRRGPDYQFASAAAVMLRVLGYPTRLVSGFYVSPDHFDPLTGHTPVVQDDLHFWAEVALPAGDWLVIEPTPGYAVLGPRRSFAEHLWSAVMAAAIWTWQHKPELVLATLALGVLWWRRRSLLDAAAAWCWRWFPGRTWQQCVRRAVTLLERRARWVGRPRTPCQTIATWLRLAVPVSNATNIELDRLTRMAEWAAYAPDLATPWDGSEVRQVCRRIVDAWTLPHWRAAISHRSMT